jgi:hypothetical protein
MAANSIIEQEPLYRNMPVGQEFILVVSNDTAVANEFKVKFVAEIHISSTTAPDTSTTDDLIGTFKTTPNNAGVGIFDFRNIVENYVKADNMAANGSSYKGTTTANDTRHPMHLIDKYSLNNNTFRYMQFRFYVEYLNANNTTNNIVDRADGTSVDSDLYSIANGYIKHTDKLDMQVGNFGFDMDDFFPRDSASKFLTNAPTSQYANLEDYGTVGMWLPTDVIGDAVAHITLTYYNNAGVQIGTENVDKDLANGSYDNWDQTASNEIVFFGCFPGNLQNWSSTFQALVTAGTIQDGYYTIQAQSSKTQLYTINLNCPNGRGYESIRLAWLNQWGAWDYYTFTKKSIKTISTKGTTYTQLGGTWNEGRYRIDSYKGGKKAFRVNATEKIKMNTGFVTEDDTVIFEELINSPEVYLLKGYEDIVETEKALNQYVTPVRVTSQSFTRKTIANDRLMQYTFEIEKSKTLRTQAV